jgi:hypothetical protein
MPTKRLKLRLRWDWSAKPHASFIGHRGVGRPCAPDCKDSTDSVNAFHGETLEMVFLENSNGGAIPEFTSEGERVQRVPLPFPTALPIVVD